MYIVTVQYVVKKIKNNLRNLQAENDPKFKKRAGWPKNLVSYKKKRVLGKRVVGEGSRWCDRGK